MAIFLPKIYKNCSAAEHLALRPPWPQVAGSSALTPWVCDARLILPVCSVRHLRDIFRAKKLLTLGPNSKLPSQPKPS